MDLHIRTTGREETEGWSGESGDMLNAFLEMERRCVGSDGIFGEAFKVKVTRDVFRGLKTVSALAVLHKVQLTLRLSAAHRIP